MTTVKYQDVLDTLKESIETDYGMRREQNEDREWRMKK